VFAAALDWPGWCRRGKGEAAAIDTLLDYADRYALVAGSSLVPGSLEVVGRVKGNKTTDFGAPNIVGPWDGETLDPVEAARHIALLAACWRAFDAVVAAAPAQLRKGPRGGGRDRDAVVGHVREAERAYSSKLGGRVPPRTPWGEQRDVVMAALSTPSQPARWPVRYSIRRCAWHVLDHAWEIEDKSSVTH
jgi:hypothetical protein